MPVRPFQCVSVLPSERDLPLDVEDRVSDLKCLGHSPLVHADASRDANGKRIPLKPPHFERALCRYAPARERPRPALRLYTLELCLPTLTKYHIGTSSNLTSTPAIARLPPREFFAGSLRGKLLPF